MQLHRARRQVLLAVLVLAGVSIEAAPKLRSVWKSPEVSKLNFAGKTIAALVITDDQSLQMSGEEALVRELNARHMTGIATYRMVPREKIATAETARPWFERAGVEGVVALRPVEFSTDRQSPRITVWPPDPSFWGYYGSSWSSQITISPSRTSTVVVVEALVFDLTRDRLVWAATSETRNPKSLPSFITELVEAVVGEMRRTKLVPPGAVAR
jgi:hypothetical protein